MDNFYNILSKYFLKEKEKTTTIEKKEIESFKKIDSKAYHILKKIWTQERDITVVEFDTESAFKKVKEKRQPKVIPLFSRFSKIKNIAAAIFLCTAITAILYKSYNDFTPVEEIVVVNDHNTKKGKKLVLEDGTLVWLNNDATIKYPNHFSSKKREISLSGEAFFEVARDEKRPFKILINNAEVTVLGTSFNIKNDSLKTEVTVKTGKVNTKAIHLNKSVDIIPGYTATVNDKKLVSYKTINENYLSWKTGEFKFNNTSVKDVIKDLNTYYEEKIIIEPNTLIEDHLTTEFNQLSFSEVSQILELTCNIKITKGENNTYKILK